MIDFVKRGIRGAAVAAALIGAATVTAPNPAHAISGGEAAAIGLGSFALGSALGAGGAYGYPYAPYGYYPPAYYAPPAPAYYPPTPRTCWDPYYRRYYAC
ncbi:MAG: hypothetical protein ACM3JG_11395 [Thiohalocapsa sp.]